MGLNHLMICTYSADDLRPLMILRLGWWREGWGEDLVGSHGFQGGTEGRSVVANR